jgi:hypothetical protein
VKDSSQAKQVLRTAADRLAAQQTGEARRRIAAKDQERRNAQISVARQREKWIRDPQAVLDQLAWICPYCEIELVPYVLDVENSRRPIVEGTVPSFPLWRNADQFVPNWLTEEQWSALPAERIQVVPRTSCGCPGEREALAKADEPDAFTRTLELSKAGLVGWLVDATFEGYQSDLGSKQTRWKGAVEGYCQAMLQGELARRPWLVMWGPFGTGKTHLGAAVLHEALNAGRLVYLRVWPEWLQVIRNSFGTGKTGAIVSELTRGHVVLIDDIDKERPAEGDVANWAQQQIYTALNYRYNRQLPTILTFNRKPMEMVPWLGQAIVDRLIESAYAILHCDGKSWRSGQTWTV